MGDPNEIITAVRNQEVDAILVALTVVGLPALATSLYRATDVGWQTVMFFQIGLYLLVVGAAGFRRRLSFRVRVLFVLAAFFSLGVSSVLTWGLIGPGILGFMACSIIATALFGSRSGILITILGMSVVTGVGIAVYLGIYSYGFDIQVYAAAPSTWLHTIFAISLYMSIVIVSSGRVYTSLVDSIRALSARSITLQHINTELEQEITKRKQVEMQLRAHEEQLEETVARRTNELQIALANVKTLKGLLPICASCKKIRDDEGYWHQVEVYIRSRSDVEFSHGICPGCVQTLYPEYATDE
jgi:hypothetical protein